MGEIVDLRPAKCEEIDGPHLAGTFVCGACEHEWAGVAPVGTTHMECPKCGRSWGAPKHAIEPEMHWRCKCGEFLFWLTPKGAQCRRCGIISSDWAS